MPRDVECPECGETLELPKAFDPAKRLRCPECDHAFRPKVGKAKAPAKKAAAPKWLPFAIGGGVLAVVAVVAVVLVLALGGKKAPQAVAKATAQAVVPGKPDSGKVKPEATQPTVPEKPEPIVIPESVPVPFTNNPPQRPTPAPVRPTPPTAAEQDGPPEGVPVPSAARSRVPAARLPATLPQRVELPPLPPPGERPVLVLDSGSHSASCKAVAFFPDGKRFATFSEDKSIRIWDVDTGLPVKTIHMPNGPSHEGALRAGVVSPDGKLIAAGGESLDGVKFGETVYLVAVETGEVVRTIGGFHRDVVTSLSFSADGKQLVSASFDGTAIVYAVATGKETARLTGHTDRVRRARFHPKDGRIATSSRDGTARVWTPGPTGYAFVELKGHRGNIHDVVWSPDGKTLATGGADGHIRTWTAAGKLLRTYDKKEVRRGEQAGTLEYTSLAFTRDGAGVVFGGVAVVGHAGVLDLATGERRIDRDDHSNTVMACATSPADDLAVTFGGNDNDMLVWRTTDGELVHKIVGAGRAAWAVATARTGTVLVGNTNNGLPLPNSRPLEFAFEIERLDFAPVPREHVAAQPAIAGYSVRMSADRFGVEVAKDGQPYLADRLKPNGGEQVTSASLLPGGKLAVGMSSSRVRVIDLATKTVERHHVGHEGSVCSVAPAPNGLFVTGSEDQTVRLWRPGRDEPVLSLFFAGREWIAWTPEGYYAASPGGERLMGWQINNGHLKAGTFHPAIQFRASLYQPEVIRYIGLAGGDLGLAVALAAKESRRPVPVVNLAQVMPPEVRITSPKAEGGDAASGKAALEVTAAARNAGKNPVQAMRLLVDGRPYGGADGVRAFAQPKPGEVTAKWTVTLTPGRHTLMVQADVGVSKGLSAPVEVVQAGDPPKLPSMYVFAVGVNEYAGKMKLNFATSDAKSVANVLNTRTKGVFEKVEVNLLTDKDATRAGVLKGLAWLEGKMTANDVGIFYFSGHGARDPGSGAFYLVPVDVDPRRPAQTCVLGDVVKDKLAGMPGRLVAVFDACHSGAAAESMQEGGADDLVRELLTDDCGVVVMCSSMGDEVSLESGATKAGFFTYSLVEGLSGKADFNNDGVVHIHEATAYAALRVKQLSRGTQNPTLGRSPHLKPFALTKK